MKAIYFDRIHYRSTRNSFRFNMKVKFEDSKSVNRICGVMVSVLASSVVDLGFAPLSGQNKGYAMCMCSFSTMHAALMSKTVWLGIRIMCTMGDMSTYRLLFQ